MTVTAMKYGVRGELPLILIEGTCTYATSTVLPALSARFVVYDISDATWGAIATSAAVITGYTEVVSTATAAGAVLPTFSVRNRRFEVPYATAGAAATLTEAVGKTLIGKAVDAYVDGNGIQYANCSSTTQAIFRIVGYDVAKNVVICEIPDSMIASKA